MVMALADALQTLLRLPGATYSCVVERDSGRVLAESGRGESGTGDSEGVVPYSVPRWGTAVAAMFDSTSGDELDDVMITGRRSYHLVRPLGAGAEVLVYLRLDRSRSNLAAARRELAAVRLTGNAPDAGTADRASAGPRGRDDTPPASRPPAKPPAAAAVPASSLVPPSTPARGLRRAAPARSGPAASGTAAADPGTPAPRRTARARGSSADRSSGAAPVRTPSTPAALSAVPTQARPAGAAVRQIPLPRRAPGRSTPDATPSPRPETRARGAVATAAEPAPEGFAMPTVLGQSWAQDPGTLRRLLAGLRRMH
jgi:hypothetical protein